jgi:hypothetical protein
VTPTALDFEHTLTARLDVKVRSPWGEHTPVTVRVDLTGQVGSGNITIRPPRRSLPQRISRMRQHLADE